MAAARVRGGASIRHCLREAAGQEPRQKQKLAATSLRVMGTQHWELGCKVDRQWFDGINHNSVSVVRAVAGRNQTQ